MEDQEQLGQQMHRLVWNTTLQPGRHKINRNGGSSHPTLNMRMKHDDDDEVIKNKMLRALKINK